MEVEIFINEQRLDTDVKTVIAETKQVNDFLKISDRQTSRTNSFSLPITEKNKVILGMMGVVGNSSLTPYRLHGVNAYRKGMQTINDGIGYFKPLDGRYKMHVYSENISLFDSISGLLLSDLDTASRNHTLNTTNWLASFNRTDYVYALADYGKTEGDTIEINYQIPSFFIKWLWNKIFSESGYTYKYVGRGGRTDYDPFLKEEWSQLAITIEEGFPEEEDSIDPIKKLEISKNKESNFNNSTVNTLGNDIEVQEVTGQITEYVRFKSDIDPDSMHLFSSSSQYNRSRIRIKESGFYKINVTGNVYNLNTENVALYIEKDGYNLFTINDDFKEQFNSLYFDNKLYLRDGEELFFKMVSLPNESQSHYSYDLNVNLWLDNTVTSVNFSSYLSKIKQTDFIKDVMNHYGLIFRRNESVYEFISIEELLDPLASYVNYNPFTNNDVLEDWSNKFNRVTVENSKIGIYGKNNHFKYKYDNSEDTYADSILKVDDETLDDDVTVLQRLYRAPDRSSVFLGENQLRLCSIYTKEVNEDGSLKQVKSNKVEPYFFKVKKTTGSFNYKLSGAGGENTFTGTYPVMSFDDIDFNNIVPNRYAAFSNMINYGQKITAEMFLTVLDISRLDFFKLKYIKQLGAIYYLNKVVDFKGNGITKVELIRIRTIEKLGAFSDAFSDAFNT